MTAYATQFRSVPCRILSFAGWLEGCFQVASKVALIDHLNRPDILYRLTNARLPEQSVHLPTFALTRASTIIVIPLDVTEIPAPIEGRKVHKTVWLLQGGIIIEGSLDLFEGVSVTEHLAHRTGFVALHDCTLYVPSSDSPTRVVPRVPYLALQTDRAIGATELEEAGAQPPIPSL